MRFIGKIFGFIFKLTFAIIVGTIVAVVGIMLAPYIAAAAVFIGGISLFGWVLIVVFLGSLRKQSAEE